MKYRLHWPKKVVDKLAELYLEAKEKTLANALTKSLATVERSLELEPFAVGESRDGGKRITFESILIVEYVVVEKANAVLIYDVRLNLPKS